MAPMKGIEKQGIVTILGSDAKPAGASLRRTLSADMSSKKWLSENGFFSMKKIASSDELVLINSTDSSPSESEEEYDENRPGQDEIWRSIQLQKEQMNNQTGPIRSGTDIWGSILSQKKDQDSSKNPPYVHPLVKKSSSCLSQKSLEICTESLGSETGSDEFLSGPPQRANSCPVKLSKSLDDVNINVVKYKSVCPQPFPPPIPSIGGKDHGNSLRMHCHRENGRLILELVSIPSRNCFLARRQNGRLILNLINPPSSQKHEEAAMAEEVVVTEEAQPVIEQNPKPRGGMISVRKSELMVKKFMGIRNKSNPTWANTLNKTVKLMVLGEELPLPPLPPPRIARLIPTPPPPAATNAASFNAYEYFWRNKTSFTNTPLKNNQNKIFHSSSGRTTYEQQELVLISPLLKGCKEQRRSLLIWEPYCIATS